MKQTRFTKEGFEKIKREYEELLKSRPDAVMHLKKAREMGDLSENGYYKASRAKLSFIDHRLFQLKVFIKQAVVVDDAQGKSAGIGCKVTLSDGDKEISYSLVGDLEANPKEGKISLLSPLGRAIEGKVDGDIVEFKPPSGVKKYILKSITKTL